MAAIGDRPGGMRQGLTRYGDEAFSLYMRRSFIKAMGYTDDGLLTSFKYPNQNENIYTYDALGRFQTDTDPVAGGWTLDRTESTTSHLPEPLRR